MCVTLPSRLLCFQMQIFPNNSVSQKSAIEYWEVFVRVRKRKSKSLFDISENIFCAVENGKKRLQSCVKQFRYWMISTQLGQCKKNANNSPVYKRYRTHTIITFFDYFLMDDNSIYNVTNDLIFSGKRKKNQRMIYYFMKEEKKQPAS